MLSRGAKMKIAAAVRAATNVAVPSCEVAVPLNVIEVGDTVQLPLLLPSVEQVRFTVPANPAAGTTVIWFAKGFVIEARPVVDASSSVKGAATLTENGVLQLAVKFCSATKHAVS